MVLHLDQLAASIDLVLDMPFAPHPPKCVARRGLFVLIPREGLRRPTRQPVACAAPDARLTVSA